MTQEEFEQKIKELGLEIAQEGNVGTHPKYVLKETASGRTLKAQWSPATVEDLRMEFKAH